MSYGKAVRRIFVSPLLNRHVHAQDAGYAGVFFLDFRREFSIFMPMTVRDKLIERILEIKDESLLKDLLHFANLSREKNNEVYELSEEQEVYLKKGIRDIEEGKTVSHEEVMTRAKTWLSEK